MLEVENFVQLQKETALTDLLNAARVLGQMPVPPDHLVLLEQIASPAEMAQVTDEMSEAYRNRSAALKHALGSNVVMQCKGSDCFYANECPLKQSGIPDSVLAEKPCVIELAAAKHVFDSLMIDLFVDSDDVRVSGVDALGIIDVIRQEIVIQRLHKCVRIKGEMYDIQEQGKFGVTDIPTVNPAIDTIERISASKARTIKALSLDRSSRFNRGAVGNEADRIRALREQVQPVDRAPAIPVLDIEDGDDVDHEHEEVA